MNSAIVSADGRMRMFSGQLVDPLNLKIEQVRLDDIAYALGNICRYGGHCHCQYSVAEHTIDVIERLRFAGADNTILLYAALHDAAEAYTGDIPRPIKYRLGIHEIEAQVERVIASAFHLDYAAFSDQIKRGVVKREDDEAGDYERSWLWTTKADQRVHPRNAGRQLYHQIARLMLLRPEIGEKELHQLGIFAGKL